MRAVLSTSVGSPGAPERSGPDERHGLILESSGHHATCRVWVGLGRPAAELAMERALAELLLHVLVLTVDRIVTVDRFRESETNFERAVESHRLVGQAMGILIERHRIVSDEAFDVLRRTSQDHNVKLREVAQRVIDTGAEPGRGRLSSSELQEACSLGCQPTAEPRQEPAWGIDQCRGSSASGLAEPPVLAGTGAPPRALVTRARSASTSVIT